MSDSLGNFRLLSPLGRGGMGEVWRAVHAPSGRHVAVKVLTHERAQDPRYREAFRDEVRAAAGLDHPNIVRVLDHGEVPEGGPERLVAGSPWLAMDLARGGSLDARCGQLPWPVVRGIVLQLLDALGHAHARGVLHRDVKPGNVLAGDPRDDAAGIRLADFGLARTLEDDTPQVWSSGGTVGFVAPEQRAGRWRDQGPWTDLYALGRTTVALVGGTRVPDGFEAWIARATAPEPEHRFRRAADAAHALARLDRPTHALVGDEVIASATWDELSASAEREQTDVDPAEIVAPPCPADWRADAASKPEPTEQVSAGLGLWGLRTLAVIGREAERSRLWALLGAGSGGPRALRVTGAAGVGKSRLAGWLCERAQEVGAATVLRAVHGPDEPHGSGLVAMLVRYLRCRGLDRGEIRARAELWLPGADRPLAEALADVLADGGSRVDAAQRRSVLRRTVEQLATERPVLVWLDDVQWGAEAVAFVREVLARSDAPIAMLLTTRDDVSGEAVATLDDLGIERLALGPLDGADRRGLVRALLKLDDALAARVEERTDGNPLFAVHLVGDWVRRGLLVEAPGGYTLRDDAQIDLPDDLFHVWRGHVERVVADEAERQALEVAAVLGQLVSAVEWAMACTARGLPADPASLERLVDERLMVRDRREASFAFVHGMLREAVERRAAEGGRLEGHHRAAADALHALDGPRAAERVGRHLLAAGDGRAATEPLLRGLEARLASGDYAAAAALADARDEACRLSGWTGDHPEAVRTRSFRGTIAFFCGRLADADELAASVEAWARTNGDQGLLGTAVGLRGSVAMERGDATAAVERLRHATSLANGPAQRGRVLTNLGNALLRTGRHEEAHAALQEAIHCAEDPLAAAHARALLGDRALRLGDLDAAEREYRATGEAFRAADARLESANTDNSLGDVLRARGDLDGAEIAYRRALAGFEALGAGLAVYPGVNLGLTHLQRGRYPAAHEALAAALRTTRGRGSLAGLVHLCLIPCAVAAGDELGWDEHWLGGEDVLAAGLVDPDVALALERAGDLVRQPERAQRAFEAALQQWRGLARGAEAERVEAKLARVAGAGRD